MNFVLRWRLKDTKIGFCSIILFGEPFQIDEKQLFFGMSPQSLGNYLPSLKLKKSWNFLELRFLPREIESVIFSRHTKH